MFVRTLPLLLVTLGSLATQLSAADWPQWRGPDRTGVSAETGLLKRWPENGPPLLWTNRELGNGYSSPSIVGDRVYILGSRKSAEQVIALDAATGKEQWAADIAPLFKNGWGDGPRGEATVDGSMLYAIGGQGTLVCVDTTTGKKMWSVRLREDLGGKMMSGWGYTESPLVDGNQVVCSPGGSKGTLAALDKKTGKLLWRSTDLTDDAAYASIIAADLGGVRQYVQMTGKGVAGVAAKDGKLLWHYPKDNYRTAVIPTPVVVNANEVFVTSGYSAGCDLIRLTAKGDGTFEAASGYTNKNMVNHHGGVVKVGNHVYGFSDGKGWTAIDLKTGTPAWAERNKLGKGSVTCADGKLYCYSEDEGTVVLVEASPDGWKEHGRFKIPEETKIRSQRGKVWTHPVVANGLLYLRDQDLLFCYDIKERTAGR